jgi:hypothetical protein
MKIEGKKLIKKGKNLNEEEFEDILEKYKNEW